MAAAINAGRVRIDENVVQQPSFNVDLELARMGRVFLDGVAIDPPSPFTIMLHKPVEFTCSREDVGRIVYELLPKRWMLRKPAISSIGRLDKDSSGQLLMTDDGDLLHKIISPKTVTPKHYTVTLRDDLNGDESALFSTGTFMLKKEDKPLKPAQWTPDGKRSGVMILSEGRYHQIRRMFEEIGNEVVTLHRTQTGNLRLDDLPVGQWRVLNEDDLENIFSKG